MISKSKEKKSRDNTISCSSCKTVSCFVKQYCSPEWIEIISEGKTQSVHKKRDVIFKEGERVFGLYFIQSGKVKVVSTGKFQKQQIVRLAKTGDLVGHRGFGSETYPIGAIAMEETRVCFVDNTMLYEGFMNNPKFTFSLMMFYSFELRKTEIRQRHLAQMSGYERMVDALLYLKDVFGINGKDKSLNVELTRQEMSELIGSSFEQVVRELSFLEKDGLIKRDVKKIILCDIEGLEKVVSMHDSYLPMDSFKKYPGEPRKDN